MNPKQMDKNNNDVIYLLLLTLYIFMSLLTIYGIWICLKFIKIKFIFCLLNFHEELDLKN
jgi:hypothetical protein